MPRSRWSRILSAMFAVWLALVMGDAGFVRHRCPMHDGAPAGDAAGHAARHLSHGAAGATNAHSGSDAPVQRGHHACTCIGACSAAFGVPPMPTPVELPAAHAARSAIAPAVSPKTAASPAPVPFALHLAQAPPRAIA